MVRAKFEQTIKGGIIYAKKHAEKGEKVDSS